MNTSCTPFFLTFVSAYGKCEEAHDSEEMVGSHKFDQSQQVKLQMVLAVRCSGSSKILLL